MTCFLTGDASLRTRPMERISELMQRPDVSEGRTIAALYLAIVPWSYGMWGVLMMSSASFNALGKPLPSTALSFTRMIIIYVPMAIFFNQLYGYQGIFVATTVTNIVMGLAGYWWFRARFFPFQASPSRQTG